MPVSLEGCYFLPLCHADVLKVFKIITAIRVDFKEKNENHQEFLLTSTRYIWKLLLDMICIGISVRIVSSGCRVPVIELIKG